MDLDSCFAANNMRNFEGARRMGPGRGKQLHSQTQHYPVQSAAALNPGWHANGDGRLKRRLRGIIGQALLLGFL